MITHLMAYGKSGLLTLTPSVCDRRGKIVDNYCDFHTSAKILSEDKHDGL